MEAMKHEQDLINDGSMQQQQYCINHPNKPNPGGICAFCLQEKLGKLVSSSFPLPISPSSPSSSSSPSFKSQPLPTSSVPPPSTKPHNHNHNHMRSRLPFLSSKKNKPSLNPVPCSVNVGTSSDVVFKRSKSIATPRRSKFLDDDDDDPNGVFNLRKRNRFWSFLYNPSSKVPCSKKVEEKGTVFESRVSTMKPRICSSLGRNCEMVVEEEGEGSGSSSGSGCLEQRKVSRSRSVGCGSRSFSGDFFEKISTGFGDCTLRRVESQREGNKGNKVISSSIAAGNGSIHHCMKERVKCGGIFGGFMMMNSSSSYLISSSSVDDGRNRSSWSWALASPMRAFSTKSTSKETNKSDSEKNKTPNLSAVPSLLTVRS